MSSEPYDYRYTFRGRKKEMLRRGYYPYLRDIVIINDDRPEFRAVHICTQRFMDNSEKAENYIAGFINLVSGECDTCRKRISKNALFGIKILEFNS
jgi:hypothetical protein